MEKINTRMRDLLLDLNLIEKLVTENYTLKNVLSSIDYEEIKNSK